MTAISVIAYASAGEAPMLARALGGLLPGALADDDMTIACRTAAGLDQLIDAPAETIRVVSLLPFATAIERPWSEVAEQLQTAFTSLAETGDPVFVLTVFRGGTDRGADAGQALLQRIRRLNLLATELSRVHGALVVDIDRVFADIGGVRLGTDYRLTGDLAAQVAGRELALVIVANGLDLFVPYEAQKRAAAWIEAQQAPLRLATELAGSDLIALGKGRNRQRVQMNTDAVQENHVGWLAVQVFKGQIGVKEAATRLMAAIRRRGARESFGLFAAALKHLARQKRSA